MFKSFDGRGGGGGGRARLAGSLRSEEDDGEYKVIITYLRHTYLSCPVVFAEARRCERGRK